MRDETGAYLGAWRILQKYGIAQSQHGCREDWAEDKERRTRTQKARREDTQKEGM